jgi:phosphoribosylformimino-5-aminoimidazole carboxamide ribotide isomerase
VTLEIVPSIDLSEGKVVRVVQGDLAQKTVYADDPVACARTWAERGATRLHVVDLDGAVAGESRHGDLVRAIVDALDIPVQVAGGIRRVEAALAWLDAGADRVVLGTKALTDPAFLDEVVASLGPRLVVAPDARGREVRVAGWTRGSGEDVVDAAKRLAGAGVVRLLVTDIARDGVLAGPNVELLAEVAEASGLPVIASGGVSKVDDLRALAAAPGIEAAIIGRALYTGDVDLAEALEVVS